MSKRVLLSGLIAVLLMSFAGTAMAQQPVQPDSITVVGSGTAYAAPDIAYVSVGVEIINSDVTAAVNSTTETINAINAAMSELGISEADIRTENFYIYREPVFGLEGSPTGEGNFRVSHFLRITVRDTEQVPAVLSAALEAGANSVTGVTYDVEDKSAVESEARAMAIENARAKADELAQLLGVQVGDVVAVTEVQGFTPLFGGFGGGGGVAMDSVAPPPMAPGSLAVNVNVQITYSIVR